MAIVGCSGLPLSIGTHSAQRHDIKSVQRSLNQVFLEGPPEELVGDRAYEFAEPLDVPGWQEAGRRDDCVSPEVSGGPEDSGRVLPPQVQTAADRRAVLRLAPVEVPRLYQTGSSRRKRPRICPVRDPKTGA